jgi:hypothetical protein
MVRGGIDEIDTAETGNVAKPEREWGYSGWTRRDGVRGITPPGP